jgi:hypothetical protein
MYSGNHILFKSICKQILSIIFLVYILGNIIFDIIIFDSFTILGVGFASSSESSS